MWFEQRFSGSTVREREKGKEEDPFHVHVHLFSPLHHVPAFLSASLTSPRALRRIGWKQRRAVTLLLVPTFLLLSFQDSIIIITFRESEKKGRLGRLLKSSAGFSTFLAKWAKKQYRIQNSGFFRFPRLYIFVFDPTNT